MVDELVQLFAASQGADGLSLELDELQEADVQSMIKTMVKIII